MPPATAEILERESRDFLADVELFLEGECAATGSEPIGFEVSFGRPLGEGEEELARAEPVEIDLGGGLTFRIAGRIDRIDKVGPAEFQVLDYKTGGFWRDDWKGTFNGGRRLQHALYGLAAVELLRQRYPKNPRSPARVLLLQPQGTTGAGADPGAVAGADRGGARRPARADCRRRVRPRRRREGVQVVRLRGGVRRGRSRAGRRPSWLTRS